LKALIVDDSSVIRKLLGFIVEQLGFDTMSADDGSVAWKTLATNNDFDVALIDWEMPEMSGIELVQKIKEEARHNHMKILMITTRNSMNDILAAMDTGIDDYLMKPIDEDSVIDRLRMLELID